MWAGAAPLPVELRVARRTVILADGVPAGLRYSLLAFSYLGHSWYAIAALMRVEGRRGGRSRPAPSFGLSPAIEGARRAYALFRRVSARRAPVFPVHLNDVVRDLLLEAPAPRGRRVTRRAV